MISRRRLIRLGLGGLAAAAASRLLPPAGAEGGTTVWVPLVAGPPATPTPEPTTPTPEPTTPTPEPTTPTPEPTTPTVTPTIDPTLDAPLLGAPSGSVEQAQAYLAARSNSYTPFDIGVITAAYRRIGDGVGLDWFLALAQCAHETGSLTSWWCQRPRRNPAGIGVTGKVQAGTPDLPPGPNWAWDGTQWREGVSFASWESHAIPAHLGRLLAYALRDDQASPAQRELIAYALAVRPLPDSLRGIAPTIVGLNGRWAYPGTIYGQSIVDLARRMRGG